jgi:hypothetical protein
MNSRQSFEKQMAWSRKTAEYLESLQQHVQAVTNAYEQSIGALNSAEYMGELMPPLHRDQQGHADMAGKMIAHIDRVHLQYIRGLLADLGATQAEINSVFGSRS